MLFVTKGSAGVLVVEEGVQSLVPAFPVARPVDVSGAGDSFSAGAALALAITGSPPTRRGLATWSLPSPFRSAGSESPVPRKFWPRPGNEHPRAVSTLAIDIGGTKFSVAVFEGKRMVERESHTDVTQWMLDRIASHHRRLEAALYASIAAASASADRWISSASAWFYPRTFRDGTISIFRITSKGCSACFLFMDNDANAGALGEALYGAGRGYRPLFYLTLSTGIGGGIDHARHCVYRGADSYAGEIGHLTIRPDGPECLCGSRGCLERMCCGCGWSAITAVRRASCCAILHLSSATSSTWRWGSRPRSCC